MYVSKMTASPEFPHYKILKYNQIEFQLTFKNEKITFQYMYLRFNLFWNVKSEKLGWRRDDRYADERRLFGNSFSWIINSRKHKNG